MRRFLVAGGRFHQARRPRLATAAAALGAALALAILISSNQGRQRQETRDVPGSATPVPVETHPVTESPATADARPADRPEPGQAGLSDAKPADRAVQAPLPPPPLPGTMVRPVDGAVIVRHGWIYSRTMGDWRWHPGVDMASPAGAPVRSAAAGRVQLVRQSKEWGWEVVIDHGGGITTRYAGCSAVAVQRGQQVREEETIASVGGEALAEVENGAHLHFEVLVGGEAVDPLRYMR